MKIFRTSRKPLLILGSGRSGTSMTAGILKKNYSFFGDMPITLKRDSNPKGFFEDVEINHINDHILEASGVELANKGAKSKDLYKYAGWITNVDIKNTNWQAKLADIKRIRELTSHSGYLFKDPRFSYTFPIWMCISTEKPDLLVVFRHPSKSAQSMLKEPSAKDIGLNYQQALEVWRSMYKNILKYKTEDMLFLHYNQVLNGNVSRIEKRLNVKFDLSFFDPKLNRSQRDEVDKKYEELYGELCNLASYQE